MKKVLLLVVAVLLMTATALVVPASAAKPVPTFAVTSVSTIPGPSGVCALEVGYMASGFKDKGPWGAIVRAYDGSTLVAVGGVHDATGKGSRLLKEGTTYIHLPSGTSMTSLTVTLIRLVDGSQIEVQTSASYSYTFTCSPPS